MTARIEADLSRQLAGDPKALVAVIITANDGLDELVARLPAGVQVEHTYRLINGLAITAAAGTLRQVARMPEVKTMEPVRDVRSYAP